MTAVLNPATLTAMHEGVLMHSGEDGLVYLLTDAGEAIPLQDPIGLTALDSAQLTAMGGDWLVMNSAGELAILEPAAPRVIGGNAWEGQVRGLRAPGSAGAAWIRTATGAVRLQPGLRLDFLTGAGLDQRIAFTRASTALRVGATGLFESVAIDAPRFEYHPITLALRGLLMEEARTNLIDYASDLTNAAYSKVGAPTITADAIAAPDGTVSADLVARTSAASAYVLNDSPKAGSALTYTASMFNKTSVGSYTTLRQQGTYPAFAEARFNNAAAAISTAAYTSGTFAAASATVTPFPGGWQRNTLTATTDTKISDTFFTTPNSNSAATDAADSVTNSAAYYWGAQLELGAFATSPIPTTAAAVTRAADVATMTGANFSDWFNPIEGTLIVEFEAIVPAASATVYNVLELGSGAAGDRHRIYVYNGAVCGGATAGGVVQADLQGAGYTPGTVYKAAYAYAANDCAMSVNGGAAITDGVAAMPAGLTSAAIGGSTVAGAAQISGHIRRVTYFPVRLPNATLQSLTA